MATHGIKIIDGDLAGDIYLHFMNSFHKGDTIEQLYNYFLNDKADFSIDTIEFEICITVYALAFWEIGELTENLLNEVKIVTDQKTTVKHYTKEISKEAGDERQNELDVFLKKISKTNPKPLKRKRQPKPNLFAVGDVLSFRYANQTYGTAFVVDVSKMSGFSFYSICRTSNVTAQPPTMQDFLQSNFYASQTTTVNASVEPTAELSVWVNTAEHKDLEQFADCFSKIGKIDFQLVFGQQMVTNDYQKFCDNTLYERQIAYTKNAGLHVDEYKINDFANVIE